jgi:hypothetical protein
LIEIPRSTLKQFRAVLRKSVLATGPRGPCPLVVCRTNRKGLSLSCQQEDVALRHLTQGSFPGVSMGLPGSLLAELEGGSGTVKLEQVSPGKGQASWHDRSGPHVLDFEIPEPSSLPPLVESAGNAITMAPEFLHALSEAARTASRDVGRYACTHLLLRGRDSAVIGTDGRQLLIQRGFPMPWSDERLIPALPVFCGRELSSDEGVQLGFTKDHVTLEIGFWLLVFRIDPARRYPNVDQVVPKARTAGTRLHIDAQDAEELIGALPRLPAQGDPQEPVTLELAHKIAVQAEDETGERSEVVLSRAKVTGPTLRVGMNRRYLLRALQLGFRDVLIHNAEKPLLCQDARRIFLWMPLVGSQDVQVGKQTPEQVSQPQTSSGITIVPPNEPRNDEHRNGVASHGEPLDVLAEAEALRGMFQEALARTSRLISALRQQRRQERAMRSAMNSLRRLQQFDL